MSVRHLRIFIELVFYCFCLPFSVVWGLPIWGALDFGSFYASGAAAAEGLNPYGVYDLTFRVRTEWFTGVNNNLNPPTALPLFELLSTFPIATAFMIWWWISLSFAIALIILLCRQYSDRIESTMVLWLVALAALWDTLHLGQIYMPLALASATAWVLIRRNQNLVVAGILIGFIAAIKPNFLVWPVLLFCAGHYRIALSSLATTFLLVLVSISVYGVETYVQWFELLASEESRAAFPTNGSLGGFLVRLGIPEAGTPLSAFLLVLTAYIAFVKRPSKLKISAYALIMSLLASPIAWGQYALFLAPIMVHAWQRREIYGLIAGLGMVIPLEVFVWTSPDHTISMLTLGSSYFWIFLSLLMLVYRTNDLWGEASGTPKTDKAVAGG
ncbi:MAG: DUF2029 domain-containing protein [Rhodobacteraceae bacterium]|nr:DUF2029 domain-containing protein [Paracoccaceae bacterium]